MQTASSTLIIPVESQVRELDAKLLLACAAAERGFPVVIGSRAFVHFRVASIPRGVYLAKSMRALSDRMFRILRQLGHEIVAWDEEGLVRHASDHYYRRRLSARAVREVSILLAWGPDDARVLREFPGYHGAPIHLTGNPRIDLLRPELRCIYGDAVAELRGKFGRFILINTNFSSVNAFVKTMNLLQGAGDSVRAEIGANAAGMTPEFAQGLSDHKQALFERFLELLPALAENFPEHQVVLRPHPAEDHEPWKRAAGTHPNVHVVNEGSVVPWLMASSVLVHNGCTTAVEAAVLGVPAVSYQPRIAPGYDLDLPNSLSLRARDLGQLQDRVRAVLDGDWADGNASERRQILDAHLAGLDGRLATDRIVDVLEQAGYASRRPNATGPTRFLLGWTHTQLRTLGKQINMRRADHRNSADFHAHRFPEITVKDLRCRIERFERPLGRFAGLRVEQMSDHVFQIDR